MDRKEYVLFKLENGIWKTVQSYKYLGNAKRKARKIMLYELTTDGVNIKISVNGILQDVIYRAYRQIWYGSNINDKRITIIEREV